MSSQLQTGPSSSFSSRVPGISIPARFRRNKKDRQSSSKGISYRRPSPEADGQTFQSLQNESPKKKKTGRFKSIDLRRYTPKQIFAAKLNSSARTPFGGIKSPIAHHRQSPIEESMSRRFSFRESSSQIQLTQNSPIMDSETARNLFESTFSLSELDPVSLQPQGLDVIKFKFKYDGLYTVSDISGEERIELFDVANNIVALDTGKLIDRVLVFQIQSKSQGIHVFEASNLQDKLNVLNMIAYLKRQIFKQPSSKMISSMFDLSQQRSNSSSDDDNETNILTQSHTHDDFDNLIDYDQEKAPSLFVSWLRKHLEDFTHVKTAIEERERDIDNLFQHLEIMKDNIDGLEQDVEYQSSKGLRYQKELESKYLESEQIYLQVKQLRDDIMKNEYKEVMDEFPRMLEELEARIDDWKDKEHVKERSIWILSSIFLVSIFILLMLSFIFWRFILNRIF